MQMRHLEQTDVSFILGIVTASLYRRYRDALTYRPSTIARVTKIRKDHRDVTVSS